MENECKFEDIAMCGVFEFMGHLCMRVQYFELNGYEEVFGRFIRLSDGLCGLCPLDTNVVKVNKKVTIVEV